MATAGSAFAGGVLTTPLLLARSATHQGSCAVTNVGTAPAEMTVSIKNNLGFTIVPTGGNCPTPPDTLAAGQSCWSNSIVNEDIYCTFVGKGKFRASVQMVDSVEGLVAALPATAK